VRFGSQFLATNPSSHAIRSAPSPAAYALPSPALNPRATTASPPLPLKLAATGDSLILLADEFPGMDVRSPHSLGGSPVSMLHVEDADAIFNQTVAAGATVKRPMAGQFYGDRLGGIEDSFGHTSWISTHKQDLSAEEIEKRAAVSH
jgi:hypothetical protein